MPLRYSRHYADVAQMSKKQVVDEALKDMNLLKSVTTHKDLFYHCGWAKYKLAIPGSFRLVPQVTRDSSPPIESSPGVKPGPVGRWIQLPPEDTSLP